MVHLLRKKHLRKRWIAGSSQVKPGNDEWGTSGFFTPKYAAAASLSNTPSIQAFSRISLRSIRTTLYALVSRMQAIRHPSRRSPGFRFAQSELHSTRSCPGCDAARVRSTKRCAADQGPPHTVKLAQTA